MSRGIDICTCGKTRDQHGAYDVEQHTFFPHPQPNTAPPKSVEDRVIDFLGSLGEVNVTLAKGGYLLTTDSGEKWEVRVFKRSFEEGDDVHFLT